MKKIKKIKLQEKIIKYMLKYKIISLLFLLTLFNSNLYSIKVTVLPFLSKDKNWIDEYMVDDGMPRAF